MIQEMRFNHEDLANVRYIDTKLQTSNICDKEIQDYFIGSFNDILTGIYNYNSAIAVPYNCGTLIWTPQKKLIGIDLALIENYYDGQDWEIPSELYDELVDKLDILIVSHGHWDHCWIELIEYMIHKKKTVLVPDGFSTDEGKKIPDGCIGISDGQEYIWNEIKFNFRESIHAYDNGRNIKMLTTAIWDGQNNILHTADADSTNPDGFYWYDKYPVDVLLFKAGGVSPLVEDYIEMESAIDLINPRKLILPIHMSELGHMGQDAGRPYSDAYEWLSHYKKKGKLGDRKYAVLFGNRVVKLS